MFEAIQIKEVLPLGPIFPEHVPLDLAPASLYVTSSIRYNNKCLLAGVFRSWCGRPPMAQATACNLLRHHLQAMIGIL